MCSFQGTLRGQRRAGARPAISTVPLVVVSGAPRPCTRSLNQDRMGPIPRPTCVLPPPMSLTVQPRPERPGGQPGTPLPPRPASQAWYGFLAPSGSWGPTQIPGLPSTAWFYIAFGFQGLLAPHSQPLWSSEGRGPSTSFQEHGCRREGPTNPCVPPSAEWLEHMKLESPVGSVGPVGVSQMPHPRAKAHKPHCGSHRPQSHICPNVSFIFCGNHAVRLAWPVPTQMGSSGGLALWPHVTEQPQKPRRGGSSPEVV